MILALLLAAVSVGFLLGLHVARRRQLHQVRTRSDAELAVHQRRATDLPRRTAGDILAEHERARRSLTPKD